MKLCTLTAIAATTTIALVALPSEATFDRTAILAGTLTTGGLYVPWKMSRIAARCNAINHEFADRDGLQEACDLEWGCETAVDVEAEVVRAVDASEDPQAQRTRSGGSTLVCRHSSKSLYGYKKYRTDVAEFCARSTTEDECDNSSMCDWSRGRCRANQAYAFRRTSARSKEIMQNVRCLTTYEEACRRAKGWFCERRARAACDDSLNAEAVNAAMVESPSTTVGAVSSPTAPSAVPNGKLPVAPAPVPASTPAPVPSSAPSGSSVQSGSAATAQQPDHSIQDLGQLAASMNHGQQY